MTSSAPAPTNSGRPRIGLLGGSFDPFHVGHLALGQAAGVALGLDQMRVIPTGDSWQKSGVGQAPTAARHRLAMARLAVAALPTASRETCLWSVDDLEIRRNGPTYTIDTLARLREREGPASALVLILGSDQFRNLASWHRWSELIDYAHLAITQREQVPLTGLPEPIETLLAQRGAEALPAAPAGSVVYFRMPAVPVSATRLRADLTAGRPVDGLLPAGVAHYIEQHHLYRPESPSQ